MNRLPFHKDSPSEDQVECLSDSLAAILVAEWKSKRSQPLTEVTVNSPGGCNRPASEDVRSCSNTPSEGVLSDEGAECKKGTALDQKVRL